ncbi:hypothetical protein [Rhodococcus sp. HS-D2]|uniref:hypothetical protein n=1 Tax=Rhodococcus sp. HS-D2 TaxID=1384636 RepID=UPI0007D8F04A|nr:hypothetical protein [Rhodococcus sp. HS-D2]
MDNQLLPANFQDKLPAYRVEPEEAQALLIEYGAPFTEAGEILSTYETIKVTDEDDKATMKLAREKRLELRKVRVSVENKRKELKADIVKRGHAIDGVARFVKEVIAPAEEYLQLQEDYAKIREAQRKADRIAKRTEALSPYPVSPAHYDLEGMSDEDFDALVISLENERQARIAAEAKAKAEAEARAEAERIEQERIRAENARLKAEAEAERAKREELERAERERKAAEEAEKRQAEETARAERLAPDRDKLLRFGRALETIRTEKLPTVTSEEAAAVVAQIDRELVKLQALVTDAATRL